MALGWLLMNMLPSLPGSELELTWERVRARMEWARRQGRRIGRP